MSKTKRCSRCGRDLPLEAFAKNKVKNDGLQGQCRKCKKETDAKHYQENKPQQLARNRDNHRRHREELDDIKAERTCHVCGENDPCCLDFHHANGDKEENVSQLLVRVGRERLLEEVAKCVVLCANCHRKLHAGRIMLD